MKKIILPIFLAALTLSAFTQPEENHLPLPPSRVHPSFPGRATENEVLPIAYYPDSLTAAADIPIGSAAPDGISVVLYVYDTLYHWHVFEQPLSKTGDTAWTARIPMPVATGFIAYRFKAGNLTDNNNDTGYFTMVYRKDGRYMPGAEAGYGLIRSPRYELGIPDYFENFSISDTATYLWMSNEVMRNHGAGIALVLPYLRSHEKVHPESQQAEAGRALHYLLMQPNTNEEVLLKAYLVGKEFLKDTSRADSIRGVLLHRWPAGALARKEAYDKVLKAATMESRMALSRSFIKDFPYREQDEAMNALLAIQYYPVYRNIISIALAGKQPEIAFLYCDSLPISTLPDLYYKSVEIPYEDWKTMDAKMAYQYSEPLFRRMLSFYDHQPAADWYYTSSEWKIHCDQSFANYFRLHARILLELERYPEALALAKKEQTYYRYKSSDLNQTEAVLLNKAGDEGALDSLLKASVRENQITPAMISLLKQRYIKSHGKQDGFDTWMDAMKDEKTRQLIQAEIAQGRVDFAAPDFSLIDNKGHAVPLKSLRGKIIVLDFWATWCAPCKAAMAGMNMAVEKYRKDTGVVFFFIDTQERIPDYKDKGRAFLQEKGYAFKVLYDKGKDMGQTYESYAKAIHSSGIPFKVVIDTQGQVRFTNIGYKGSPSGLSDEISTMIELIRDSAPSVSPAPASKAGSPTASGPVRAQKINLPYRSDSIFYDNPQDTIHIGATLTTPLNGQGSKAVILLSGTGQQNRDGLMAGHALFALLADSLTRRGIVVLRSDDRGTGQTNGDYANATTVDFADDAIAAVNYLRSRKDLHLDKIGLLGHSEGGMAAAIAAAKDKDIAFVISLSSPGQTGLEALLLQNKNIVAASPIPAINKLRFDSVNNLLFHIVYNNVGKPDMEQKLRTAYAFWKSWDDSVVKANNLAYGGHFFFPFESYVKQATGRWYQGFIQYDPAAVLPKIQVPYLAINGDKDEISNGAINLKGIAYNLARGGNKQVTTWLVPGLNHLYQHCRTCEQAEYSTLPETMAPEVMTRIGDWIQAR